MINVQIPYIITPTQRYDTLRNPALLTRSFFSVLSFFDIFLEPPLELVGAYHPTGMLDVFLFNHEIQPIMCVVPPPVEM